MMNIIRNLLLSGALGLLMLLPKSLPAQFQTSPVAPTLPVNDPTGYVLNWCDYDPFWRVSPQIANQAYALRAQGQFAIDLASARQINAEAVAMEIENQYQAFRKRWEIRMEAKENKMQLNHLREVEKMEYLNGRKWVNNRTWNKLENHPELSRGAVETGAALNFLLDRLAVAGLPIEFDRNNTVFGPKALEEMQLDQAALSGIRLRQGKVIFSLSDFEKNEIQFWPHLLDKPEFDSLRRFYLGVRDTAISEAKQSGTVSRETREALAESLGELESAFYKSPEHDKVYAANRGFRYYGDVARFFTERKAELRNLQETGDIRPKAMASEFDPEKDAANLVALLSFMNRTGLEFAPANPSDVTGYHRLFVMMRALYLTVCDNDESIVPASPRAMAPTGG